MEIGENMNKKYNSQENTINYNVKLVDIFLRVFYYSL